MKFEEHQATAAPKAPERELDLDDIGSEAAIAEGLDFMRTDPAYRDRDEVRELEAWLTAKPDYAADFHAGILDKIAALNQDIGATGSRLKLRPSEIADLALQVAAELEFGPEVTISDGGPALPAARPASPDAVYRLPDEPLALAELGHSNDPSDADSGVQIRHSHHDTERHQAEQALGADATPDVPGEAWGQQALAALMKEAGVAGTAEPQPPLKVESRPKADPAQSEFFLKPLEMAGRNYFLKPVVEYLESGTREAERDRARLARAVWAGVVRFVQDHQAYPEDETGRPILTAEPIIKFPSMMAIFRKFPELIEKLGIRVPEQPTAGKLPELKRGSAPSASVEADGTALERWVYGREVESVAEEMLKQNTAPKEMGIIWRNFPDYRQRVIDDTCSSLMGVFEHRPPAQITDKKLLRREVVSSLKLAVDAFYAENQAEILRRLELGADKS